MEDANKNSNEIIDSVNGVLKTRLFSTVYGTFAISWALIHWNLVYTLTSVSEQYIFEQTRLLKNDYLYQEFFNWGWHFVNIIKVPIPIPNDVWFYISWIVPFFMTWILIWKFPNWVLYPAFVEEDNLRRKRAKIRIENNRLIVNKETDLILAEEKQLKQKESKAVEEKKIIESNPEILWDKEYQSFKQQTSHYHNFKKFVDLVYTNYGWVPLNAIFKGLFIYLDSHGLIETEDTSNNNGPESRVSFTEKGKYFVQRYTEDEKYI